MSSCVPRWTTEAVPRQWASVSDSNSECVPISSRDGAPKRDQRDPNDRWRDTCKFTFKEFHSFFSMGSSTIWCIQSTVLASHSIAKHKPRIQCNSHRTCSVTLAWQNTEVLRFKTNFLLFILYFTFDSKRQGVCWVPWRYYTEPPRPRGVKPKLPSCHLSALPTCPFMSFHLCHMCISCHQAACGLGQCELAFLPPWISWIQQDPLKGPFSCPPCGTPSPGRTEASCTARQCEGA